MVVVASEGPRVDLQLLRTLSVLQSAKRSLGSSLVNALGVSGRGASSESRTLTAGCVVPSLFFVFRVSPGAPYSRRNCEKLQGSLDKQLAYLMRKLRLPEGKGPEPLFSLSKETGTACVVSAPPTDDIVGVFDGLFSGTFDRVGGRGGGVGEGGIDANSPGMQPLIEMVGACVAELTAASSVAAEASDAAPNKPFSSNAGHRKPRRVVPTLLPSASAWFLHACALHDLFRFPSEGRSGAYAKTVAALSRPRLGALSDVSWQYSTVTCERAMPIARAAYTEDLPELYTRRRHLSQLQQVLTVFRQTAVGPACPRYQEILEKECEAIWTAGRQMCDTVSLTGQPCTLPRHDSSVAHTSGVSMPRACDCGTSVEVCGDAFELAEANSICRPCCSEHSSLGLGPQSNWKLYRLGGADDYQYDDSKAAGGAERGGLEKLPGFLSGRGQLFPWLTTATVQQQALAAANSSAAGAASDKAAEPGKRTKEKQGKDGSAKAEKAEDTVESEWPTLEAFPTLGETIAKSHKTVDSDEPEDEDAEREDEEEQPAVQQREPQVLQVEHGLGAWLIAARRIALSASGTENDDEIALRAGGGTHETAPRAQRAIGSHGSLGVSVAASEDRASTTVGHTVGSERGLLPLPNANETGGLGSEWAGSVAIGKRAVDHAAAASGAASAKGVKSSVAKRGKKGKAEKDEMIAEPTPAGALKFDSQGRPIIRVGPDGELMMPSHKGLDSANVQADAAIVAGGKAGPPSLAGKSKSAARPKQQRRKQKGSATKSGAEQTKEQTEEEEQRLVRVGFEYECSSCGCRMLADEGVDVAATAAAQHRNRNRQRKKKDRTAALRERSTSPTVEEQEKGNDEGNEEPDAVLEKEEEELTVEKRRPLGLVDSMPLLLKCSGGGSNAKVGQQDPTRNNRCRKYAQLRRIFFTTPAVCAPAPTPSGQLSDGAPALDTMVSNGAAAGENFDMEKVAPKPPRTVGGEAVDHAAVAAWRCKLRLKAASLADAYLVVGGNPVPALDFLHERQNDTASHKQNGSTGAATGAAGSASVAGSALDKAGLHSYGGGALGQTAGKRVVDGHGIDLFEEVEVVLPAGTYFVLRLPSVPLLCGQPLLVGPLAKELRVDSEYAKGAGGLETHAKRDGSAGAKSGQSKKGRLASQQVHAGLRLMLGEFLRPVGGKETEEEQQNQGG